MAMGESGWEDEEQVLEAAVEELRGPGIQCLTCVEIAFNPMITETGMERKAVTRRLKT